MSNIALQSTPFLYLKVSGLAQAEFCIKRSKIELFQHLTPYKTTKASPSIVGNRLHFLYSYPFRSFDRVYLRSRLTNKVWEKRVDSIFVRGKYDDLRVIIVDGKKYTILLEIFTTSRQHIPASIVNVKIRQLQLYMWLMKEELEKLGFPLWKNACLEIYSQRNGELIRMIPVYYYKDIEDWIRYVVECFQGLKPIRPPDKKVCRYCLKIVKNKCLWYRARMKREEEWEWT